MLDKMERIEPPQTGRKCAAIHFDVRSVSGQDVLTLENVTIGYTREKPLCRKLQARLKRKDRVALVGPNGIGKDDAVKDCGRAVASPFRNRSTWNERVHRVLRSRAEAPSPAQNSAGRTVGPLPARNGTHDPFSARTVSVYGRRRL